MADATVTQTPDQLPRATDAPPAALTIIQQPGGPVQSIELQKLIGSITSVDVVAATKAEAGLAYADGTTAYFYAPIAPDVAGYYVKAGASGAGSWQFNSAISDLISNAVGPAVALARSWASQASGEVDPVNYPGLHSAIYSALLARGYAVGTADVDVPGGSAGDRPAQFWAIKAQAALTAINALFLKITLRPNGAIALADAFGRAAIAINTAGRTRIQSLFAPKASIDFLTVNTSAIQGRQARRISARAPYWDETDTDAFGRIRSAKNPDGSTFIQDLRRPGNAKVYAQVDNALARIAALEGSSSTSGKSANTQTLIAAVRRGWMIQPTARLAAGNTPTLTLGANGGASGISGSALVAMTDGRFGYAMGLFQLAGASYPRNGFMKSRGAYYGLASDGVTPVYSSAISSIEFVHTGTQFEWYFCSTIAGNIRVLVNGIFAGTVATLSNGGLYNLLVAFPSAGTRTIRLESPNILFGGVRIAAGNSIASSAIAYPLAGILGDSFVEGTGAGYANGMEVALMCRALGLNPASGGVGSTGMINPGGANTSGGAKVNFANATRLKDLTLSGLGLGAPSLGLMFASLNDQGISSSLYSPYGATLQAAITAVAHIIIDAWIAANPGKPLILFGPMWPSGQPNNRPTLDIYRIRDGVQQAAWQRNKDGAYFLDRLMPAQREGVYSTATDQAFLYTGGADGTDPTHPTPAGHEFDSLVNAYQLRDLILNVLP